MVDSNMKGQQEMAHCDKSKVQLQTVVCSLPKSYRLNTFGQVDMHVGQRDA